MDWPIDDIKSNSATLETNGFVTSYRVWGSGPIKALFLHGGPGSSCDDYKSNGTYINYTILNPAHYTVLEVDQLGTGLSAPSLRNGLDDASQYLETRGQDIVVALVAVLDHLGWDQVFLHGGSWGSTLALWFAQMHPQRVNGMVLRGIFTGTQEELDVTYTKKGAGDNKVMNDAFDALVGFAREHGYEGGDDDAKAFLAFYRNLMATGPRNIRDMAAWNFWVQELHVMGEPEWKFNSIMSEHIAEARSVAFWEAHIFYEMLYGPHPVDLLDVKLLPKVPIYIVQGRGDDVCPPVHARHLETILREAGFAVNANYVDDGHKVTGNGIRDAVRAAAVAFATDYHTKE